METFTSTDFRLQRRASLRTNRSRKKPKHSRRSTNKETADIPTIKLVQQGVGIEQGTITNREIFGCYRRPSDFTLTCVGYMIGIHNFFRLPHLCYQYGGGFIIAFLIMLVIIGTPMIFLEFSIGQYYSVGLREAFSEMAPIMTGTTLILTWNSLITCIMYTSISTWIRVYSGVCTSCFKPWEHCDNRTYFNTQYCYTGALDDDCNDLKNDLYPEKDPKKLNLKFTQGGDSSIYFNYGCVPLLRFCEIHNWNLGHNDTCIDPVTNKNVAIHTRRIHSATEYFYGAACGMERVMEDLKRNITAEIIKSNPSKNYTEEEMLEKLASPKYTKSYWSKENQQLQPDKESANGRDLKIAAFTTWVIFGVLLFEGLLSMTVFTYITNGIPFLILFSMTLIAVNFENSFVGIKALLYGKKLLTSLWNLEMWAEAVMQVIITTGIGNGVLISLSTFNRLHHGFLFDALFTVLLNMVTSICATVIAFSTIGHVITEYQVQVEFFEFIKTESKTSSIEFGYIIYTHFLAIISERRFMILMFFFMATSFTTDSCLRMIQNLLDTLISIFPRLRPHPTPTLIGICFIGLLLGLPTTKSGGIVFYVDYEYYLLRFIFPLILFMEAAGICWIYKAGRIMDNAEAMQVVHNRILIWYFWTCLQILAPIIILATLVSNIYYHKEHRFNYRRESVDNIKSMEYFSVIFCAMPIVLWVLGFADEVMQLDSLKDIKTIFFPKEDKHLHFHHRLMSDSNQVNQLDLIVNQRALIDKEDEMHIKEMEKAITEQLGPNSSSVKKLRPKSKPSKLAKASSNLKGQRDSRKPEIIEMVPVREAKELNNAILSKVLFKRDDKLGMLQIRKEIVEKLIFTKSSHGKLKIKRDAIRKTLFRRGENGRLKISRPLLGNMMLTRNKEGKVGIRKEDLQKTVMRTKEQQIVVVNKHLLRNLKTIQSSMTFDRAKEFEIGNALGLLNELQHELEGQTKISALALKSLVVRKHRNGNFMISKKLLSKLLLCKKYYTGHTFMKKRKLRAILCKPAQDGDLTLRLVQLGKLLFRKNNDKLKISNYTVRGVILKETPHSLHAHHRELHKIRKFLVKSGADVKLWSDAKIYKKFRKNAKGNFLFTKGLIRKLGLKKVSTKYAIGKRLLKRVKRKGNLNLGKHTATKLKLAKYPFEKYFAFNDTFTRLRRDNNTEGAKMKKLITVLKILLRKYRKEHHHRRHSSFAPEHFIDHRTNIDIWVEKIFRHLEEWPGRLDDNAMDSDNASSDSMQSDTSIRNRRVHKTRLKEMGRNELQHELEIVH